MNSLSRIINHFGVGYREEQPAPPSPTQETGRYLDNTTPFDSPPATRALSSRNIKSISIDYAPSVIQPIIESFWDFIDGIMPWERNEAVNAERVNQCTSAIQQAFPLPAMACYKPTKYIHFFYSNDFKGNHHFPPGSKNFTAMIKAMEEKPETQSKYPRIGLVIGQSSLPDIAPELAGTCDIVIAVDYDLPILHFVIKRIELLSQCESTSDESKYFTELHRYIYEKLLNETYLDEGHYHSDARDIYLQHLVYREGLGEHWMFSSEARLNKVKEAAQKIKFIPVYANIFSGEFQQELSKILLKHRAKIQVMNLTNVFDYRYTWEKPSQLIRRLPVSEQAVIHSSRILSSPAGSSVSNLNEHCKILDELDELDEPFLKDNRCTVM